MPTPVPPKRWFLPPEHLRPRLTRHPHPTHSWFSGRIMGRIPVWLILIIVPTLAALAALIILAVR